MGVKPTNGCVCLTCYIDKREKFDIVTLWNVYIPIVGSMLSVDSPLKTDKRVLFPDLDRPMHTTLKLGFSTGGPCPHILLKN